MNRAPKSDAEPRAALLATLLAVAGVPVVTACAASAPPPPVPGGRIDTLALGHYTCELPGDAGGPSGTPMPEYDFRIVNASSYKAGGIRGSYLFAGDRVVMTGGKLKGLTLRRISIGFLRQIAEDGSDGPMRCVRTSRY
ncbi:hypothetical protein [Novosphingobium album (ex Hu et al. 2023)]|uniref:Elongation factor P n=1 Tax=Novosphingobium album (ex Hu et al. 2023) TaxID=2930093 RepID=A0ABT0AY42_9SPHN|nr:hypothetical protein [Novosphingobium album (ex Hu et al. 2023)]MCJ2177601.1 hypothetical protein [Novosphingobium album (ex Hu et al. 2023)]